METKKVSKQHTQRLTKVELKDLKLGPPLDRPLPDGFIERVVKYKNKLSEVENTNLEEAVLNFQRDHNPERELEVWEWIAENYEQGFKANPKWSLAMKKSHYSQLLKKTLGIVD